MVNYIKWPHYRKMVIYFPLYALNRHPVETQYADHIIFPNISFQQSLYSKTEMKYQYSSCLLMEWLSPEYTISCKDKYKTTQKTWWRQQQTGKPSFPPALQTVPSAPDKRRLNYTLEEQGAILYGDPPGRAFVTLSTLFRSRIIFYLARWPAEWKISSIIFYLLYTFNSPTLFHLPSFVQSLFLQRPSIYIFFDILRASFLLM